MPLGSRARGAPARDRPRRSSPGDPTGRRGRRRPKRARHARTCAGGAPHALPSSGTGSPGFRTARRRSVPDRRSATGSARHARSCPATLPPRLHDRRSCGRRSVPDDRGSGKPARRTQRCRRPGPGAPALRRLVPPCLYPSRKSPRHKGKRARPCDAARDYTGIQCTSGVRATPSGGNLTMSRLTLALLGVATITAACYQDDTRIAPNSAGPSAKVLLTDDPFPFDSVQSVQVYIVSIALSTHPDTGTSADSMQWVTVAAPHRQVDLLTLQQGLTDSLGVGTVRADQYKAVLVTINVDSSAGIRFKNGSPAVVRGDGSRQESYGVFNQAPITIPDTGAVIVMHFEVCRSFRYNQPSDYTFACFPAIL